LCDGCGVKWVAKTSKFGWSARADSESEELSAAHHTDVDNPYCASHPTSIHCIPRLFLSSPTTSPSCDQHPRTCTDNICGTVFIMSMYVPAVVRVHPSCLSDPFSDPRPDRSSVSLNGARLPASALIVPSPLRCITSPRLLRLCHTSQPHHHPSKPSTILFSSVLHRPIPSRRPSSSRQTRISSML
jgi:hypothetical protein